MWFKYVLTCRKSQASVAQLGERQTEDLKVPCSIHGGSKSFFMTYFNRLEASIFRPKALDLRCGGLQQQQTMEVPMPKNLQKTSKKTKILPIANAIETAK